MTILLNDYPDGVINLKDYKGELVTVRGTFEGERLILKKGRQVQLSFDDCTIRTTRPNEAISIDDCIDTWLDFNQTTYLNNAINVWNKVTGFRVRNLLTKGGQSAIRISSAHEHSHIRIDKCTFIGQSEEALYIGPSRSKKQLITGVVVNDCTAINSGLEGFQIGSADFHMKNCRTITCGRRDKHQHNFDITINPNSEGYFEQCSFGRKQILESKVWEI